MASWLTFRSLLRTRWAVWLGVALLVGATAGAVMAGVAGARRTATAHDRFVERQHGVDASIAVQCQGTSGDPGCVDQIAALPSVADATAVELFDAYITANGQLVQPDPTDGCYSGAGWVGVLGDRTGRFGTELNDTRIVAGRRADPAAWDEVVVPRALAERVGLNPGSTLLLSQLDRESCGPVTGRAPVPLHVVGVGVAPGEVPPASGDYFSFVQVTPAFVASPPIPSNGPVVSVRFRAGADMDAVLADVERIGLQASVVVDERDRREAVDRGFRPHAVALAVGAALVALAGAFVLGQALLRQSESDAADGVTLAALGMSRRGQFACTMLPAVFLAGVAGVSGGVVAVALSPLTPVGPARAIEPDPGPSIDAAVLAAGVASTVLFVIAVAALAAWRRSRRADVPKVATSRGSAVAAGAVADAGFPPTVVSGVQMALNRGRGTVPVLTSVSALVIAIFTIVGALTFGQGLDHLLDTPRLRGVNWDLYLFTPVRAGPDGEPVPIEPGRVEAVLADAPQVDSFAGGVFWPPFPGGRQLEVGPQRLRTSMIGFAGSADVGPSLIRGRAPDTSAEVLLAPETLDDLGLDIGDTVELHGQAGLWDQPGEETRLEARIVGVGLVPIAGGDARLGRGAVLSIEGVQRLNPDAESDGYWLQLADGVDPETAVSDLLGTLGAVRDGEDLSFFPQAAFEEAVDVRHLEPLDRVPVAYAVMMGALAVGVMVHVLVNALRANRRDLAVMRALGFRRGDVQRAVAWQSIIYASVALAVGVPLGVIAGRIAWRSYADRLGAVPEPVVSWAPLGFVVAGVLVVAAMCGLAVSWRRAAASPAAALRSE